MSPNLLASTPVTSLGAAAEHITGITNSQEILSFQKRNFTEIQSSHNTSATSKKFSDKKISDKLDNKLEIAWKSVAIFIALHSICLYFFYLTATLRITLRSHLFVLAFAFFGGLGITAGVHRLWAHRSYKANLPLRIFLMLAQSAALQNNIHEWVRDHRVHHKFTDTDADPHSISRGFFFSHMGWLMCKKHKDVKIKGKTVDMSDVLADPVVQFQMKYYLRLGFVMNFLLPSLFHWYFCGEDMLSAGICSIARYTLSLHGTWLVNSAAHYWGTQPYDKTIKPTENLFVAICAFGEGWHNYHHVFPWDYKAAELGNYKFNFTTAFLDLMAKIGWATEMKTASDDMIRKRLLRTGDGTWPDIEKLKNSNKIQDTHDHQEDNEMIWGWGDKDMDKEEAREIKQFNRMQA